MTLLKSLIYIILISIYNRRRRKLFFRKECSRKTLSEKLTNTENYFIADSMPLETCNLSRSSRTSICKEDYQTSPYKAYCASLKLHFYSYKIHAVCSARGVFSDFEPNKLLYMTSII